MPIDMSAATAPPKKRTAASSAVRTPKAPVAPVEVTSRQQRREQGLLGVAALGQGLLTLFGQYADAATVRQYFPAIAHEASAIAEENDTFAKPIDFIIAIGPYGGLLAAVLPFAMQVAANHKLANATMLGSQGVVPPEVLEAKYKTEMMRNQAEQMRAQQKAVAEAMAAQKEMEELLQMQTVG